MKFPVELAVFALFYLFIIILFNSEASAEPRGVEENIGRSEKEKAGEQSSQAPSNAKEGTEGTGTENSSANIHAANSKDPPTFPNVATADPTNEKDKGSNDKDAPKVSARQASGVNDSNPLADLFQITDPAMRTAMASIYGAYRGNDQCSRKAFCMLGNYLKDMPGRDLVFMLMGNYIPQEYSLSYEIFKAAVMYGQNCNVYVCVPDAPIPADDAASAARPKVAQPASQNSNPSGSQSNSFPR